MNDSTDYNWYKQKVSAKMWDEYYSKTDDYTFLGTDEKLKIIGFLAVIPPKDCELCSDDDLRRIDDHRKATHHYPRPFKDISLCPEI